VDQQPRPQHYLYAHRVLPTLFYQNPQQFLSILTMDGIAFLRFFWDRTLQDHGDEPHTPPQGMNYETRALDDGTLIAIIELPQPERMAEAYFVAAVFRDAASQPLMRYFTLEYGMHILDNTPRTVLCEWTLDGKHLNFGDGPEPKSKAFFDAILAHLQ
jgi:hypothetical protein